MTGVSTGLGGPRLLTAGRRHRARLDMTVFEATRRRIRYTFEHFNTVVISWSGGKDSTVCLELAREAARELGRLPLNVFFLDEEAVFPETIALAQRHARDPEIKFSWACVPARYRNSCSNVEPDFIPWDPARRSLWIHQPPSDAVWPAGHEVSGWTNPPPVPLRAMRVLFPPEELGEVAEISGLRAAESFVRLTGIMSSGSFITKGGDGLHGVRPIYDWTPHDVWLVIKQHGWDYNRAYDKLWRAGASINEARVAPIFAAEAASKDLRRIMLYWPEFWARIRRRVRGAQAVALYGGKLHEPLLLPGETWQTAAERYRLALSLQDRDARAAFVAKSMRIHARHSGQLHERVRCFKCSLSWRDVARLYALGDRHDSRGLKHHAGLRQAELHKLGAPHA